jgi:hypothetical protein
MTEAAKLTKDEATILVCFADILEQEGIEGLYSYLTHCGIELSAGSAAGESLLSYYRNPLGYDVDRAAMHMRTWPPISARILERQSAEAERRADCGAKRKRAQRSASMNGRADAARLSI